MSYDFQTILGEMGQPNAVSWNESRLLHEFLKQWGAELSQMDVDSLSDHYARRGAFEFRNDYVRILNEGGKATITPRDWRIADGVTIDWATAEPYCKADGTIYFIVIDGEKPRLSINGKSYNAKPDKPFTAAGMTFCVLSKAKANTSYKINDRLYFSDGLLYQDGTQIIEEKWQTQPTQVTCTKIRDSKGLRQVTMGGQKVAAAPVDKDFEDAAVWEISGLESLSSSGDLYLQINYRGDVARVYADGQLVEDNYWNGKSMLVRMSDLVGKRVELRILPLGKPSSGICLIVVPRRLRSAFCSSSKSICRMMKRIMRHRLLCSMLLALCAMGVQAKTVDEVKAIIRKVNTYWQTNNPAEVRSFWDNAAYHTGNMEVYKLLKDQQMLDYSIRWAEHNQWKGATEPDPAKWKYKNYGEGQDYVLFGDWQICFQTYIDLYNLQPNEYMVARAKEVMGYEAESKVHDYWWWADALYMVMPVMTKMYRLTGDEKYLRKLYDNILYSDSIMLDRETGLYFRDGKYVYPKHKTEAGKKDFWARGDGWVLAGLAKVLQDMPETYVRQPFFVEKYTHLARSVKKLQQPQGHWTRSMMDPEQAPGYETSGTAFFCYGLLWGVNNGYLSKKEFAPTIEKAWNYLTTIALQKDGKIGYVQPIGERAIPGQTVDANSQANFGVGAFLLAACEYVKYISR